LLGAGEPAASYENDAGRTEELMVAGGAGPVDSRIPEEVESLSLPSA